MNKSAREHYNHLKEIINRSENRAGQARFGMNLNLNQVRDEINRDFNALSFIAEKNAPHKVSHVKKMHSASLRLLDGKITERDFNRTLDIFQMDRPMQPPVVFHKQKPNSFQRKENPFDIFKIDNRMSPGKIKHHNPNSSFVNNLFFDNTKTKNSLNHKRKMQKNPFADAQKMFRWGR